jgi:outer membrane immunogenic protein
MRLVSGALALTLSAIAVSANAADIYRAPEGGYKDPPVAATLWAGSYIGVNGGYAWGGESDLVLSGLHVLVQPDPAHFKPEGGFGGGQIGHNWQRGAVVFGIEADIQAADLSASGFTDHRGFAKTNLDWFGTVRGRLGYSVGSALLYGTGGFAVGGAKDEVVWLTVTRKNDGVATGYAAGGGIEYAFSPKWSGKVEYQYINLGGDNLSYTAHDPFTGDPTGTAAGKFNHEYNTVRGGLNYHIGGGYDPLK